MNRETLLVAVIALLIGGIFGYIISEKSDYGYHWGGQGMMDDDNFLGGMHGRNIDDQSGYYNKNMGNMMRMVVSSEREFIEEMIPHHQEAVDTAKEVIARGGTTPAIKQLAENIVATQEKEIADMKQWYQAWYGVEYKSNNNYRPMMRDLKSLSGADLDKVFLEDMIMHHMGAIMMSRSVQPYIKHSEMDGLTQNIVSSQAKEISEMRQMLEGFN